MGLFLQIFIFLYTCYGIWMFRYMKKALKIDLKYLEIPFEEIEDRFKPITRQDRKNWRLWEIYFGSIFLFPIKFLGLIISISILNLASQLIKIDPKNPNAVQPKWQVNLLQYASIFSSRLMMFSTGFFYIKKTQLKIKDFDPEYPSERYADRINTKCPIVISNHSNWSDIMMVLAKGFQTVSFLSKASIAKYPLFGSVAQKLQCIFLEREQNNDRSIVLEKILERGKLISEGKNLPPICIFPEGTVSNGNYLLTFKKGAFEPKLPIKMYCIKYKNRYFKPAQDIIPTHLGVIILFSQIYNEVEFFEFEPYFPDHLQFKGDHDDWQIYASQIRKIMLKATGYKDSNSGYRDVIDFENFVKDFNKQQKEQHKANQKSDQSKKSQ